MHTHELLDHTFDKQFVEIEGLRWLPWVGSSYQSSHDKLLILGESVYNWTPSSEKTKDSIERSDNLRRLHVSHALNEKSKAPYVRNIERALFNMNRHQFARHLPAIQNGNQRGVYEQEALPRRIQD